MPERQFAELKLAIAGPIANLVLAGLFLSLQAVLSRPWAVFLCHWIGAANLTLGLFNLLPAFPLDGGRALRSILEVRQGRVAATQTSVRFSKGFAIAIGLLGLLAFNFLLILIALFIYGSGQSELNFLLSRGLLRGLKAGEVAVRIAPIPEKSTLSEAAEIMIDTRSSALPVDTADSAPAIITLGQVKSVPRRYWDVTIVRDVMEELGCSLEGDEPLSEALREIANTRHKILPVREHGHWIGLAKLADLQEIVHFRHLEEARSGGVDRAA